MDGIIKSETPEWYPSTPNICKKTDLQIPKTALTNQKCNKRDDCEIPPVHKSQKTWIKSTSQGTCKFSGRFLKE